MMLRTGMDAARDWGHALCMDRKPVHTSQKVEAHPGRVAVALNLRALMERADWNQTELARRSGVSQRHISYILSRQTDATASMLDKLAKAFGREGYELLVAGLHEEILESTGNLNHLVAAYVRDPAVRKFLDAALNLTPPKKPR